MSEDKKKNSKKKIVKRCFFGMIGILFIVGSYTQMYKPITIMKNEVECFLNFSTYDAVQSFAEDCRQGEQDNCIGYSVDNGLPSTNPDDYFQIEYDITIRNRSLVERLRLDAYVVELGENKKNVLWANAASSGFVRFADRLEKVTICVRMFVYKGDMTEEDVKELVKDIKIKFVSNGTYLGKREKTITFDDVDNLKIESGLKKLLK